MEVEEVLTSPVLREWINPDLLDLNTLEKYREQFLNATPFSHLYIDDLIVVDRLEAVADELSNQEFEIKEADLFQLAQTQDFDHLNSEMLQSFKDLLRSDEFIAIMEYISGIELSDNVDSLGNIYTDTDYLLCHDDKLVKRKIAYILYLTDLNAEDGGALHLFDSTNGTPDKIVKRIYPKYNRLTFFKVTRKSFHEVGEVLKPDVYRVSISGWFNNASNPKEKEEETKW